MAKKAEDIMTRNPTCVTPDTRIADAARRMKEEEVGILPVVDREGSKRLVGVITDRDIAIRCVAEGHDSSKCSVREALSADVRTAKRDDDVDDVMDVMAREQVRRIPVVDDHGELVGIIAQADLVTRADDRKAERTVEKISHEGGRHAQ
jgi:CBS domain-containing protein